MYRHLPNAISQRRAGQSLQPESTQDKGAFNISMQYNKLNQYACLENLNWSNLNNIQCYFKATNQSLSLYLFSLSRLSLSLSLFDPLSFCPPSLSLYALSRPSIYLSYLSVLSLSLSHSLCLSEITVSLADKYVPSQADNGLCPTGLK